MMLRSKTGNANPAPVEIKKRKQDKNVVRNPTEPVAKKSIGDISSGIQVITIDSAKRPSRPNDENKAPETMSKGAVRLPEIDPLPDFDYDREEASNLESVSDYAMDIFKYYKSREKDFRVVGSLDKHPDIDIKTRAILIDWLVELQENYELNHETLYSSVKLVDLYLANTKNVTKANFQLVGSAAIFISAKFDERFPPTVDELIFTSGDRFNRRQLLAMERSLFETVGFDLGSPLSYRYLRRLARVTRTRMAELTLARYILETTLLVYDFSLISASRLAAGCFLLAMKMKDASSEWNAVLQKYSGYTAEEVTPLVEHINHTMHYVTTSWAQLVTIRNKYSHDIFHRVSRIPLLPDTLAHKQNFTLPEFSFP